MNTAAGRNLDWFWRAMFLEPIQFDQAIDSATQTTQGAASRLDVVYENNARDVFPLLVRVTFTDSTTREMHHPVDIWRQGPTYRTSYTFPGKRVARLEIDPLFQFPDRERANNVWVAH
jgi:hypothetical protein